MVTINSLETKRLKLRQWKKSDYPFFAQMNSSPLVMQYYPSILSELESNKLADKICSIMKQKGWGFWAVEEKSTGNFIGFVGLNQPGYDLPVTPCVEIGWRLGNEYWGKGYATEAASKALEFGFNSLDLQEIYAFASVQNQKSWKVMERINMINTNRNFEHPIIPKGHTLSEHVLYKITKDQWLKTQIS